MKCYWHIEQFIQSEMLLPLNAFTHSSHVNANNIVHTSSSVQEEGQIMVRKMPVKPLIIVRFEKFKMPQKGTEEQEKLACMKFSRILRISRNSRKFPARGY